MTPSNSSEDTVRYLLLVIKNTPDIPKPNYHEVAKEAGINNANNAQKRFKRIIEEAGFALIDGKVTLKDGAVVAFNSPSAKSTSARNKKGAATPSKKRKLEENEIALASKNGVAQESSA
ncbi:hypothetical protein DV736_g2326, partial [Chaetothyriales sp. CBS 134916]